MDEHEEMMERIEAKVDAVHATVKQIQQLLMPGCGLPPKPVKAKAHIPSFTTCLRDQAQHCAAELMDYLHRHIDVRYGVDSLLYIQAAMDAEAIDRPPQKIAEAEFPGHLGARSMYNDYVGMSENFKTKKRINEYQRVKDEIRKMLVLPQK